MSNSSRAITKIAAKDNVRAARRRTAAFSSIGQSCFQQALPQVVGVGRKFVAGHLGLCAEFGLSAKHFRRNHSRFVDAAQLRQGGRLTRHLPRGFVDADTSMRRKRTLHSDPADRGRDRSLTPQN